jgi:hypothetical protein
VFDGIDEIDWLALEAGDVPWLLRDFAAADRDARLQAYESLRNRLVPMRFVCEAAAPSVPFLVELLEQPDFPGKEGVLYLLDDMVEGEDAVGADGAVARARGALARHVDVLAPYLDDDSRDVREVACWVLAALPDAGATSGPLLAARYAREPDPAGRLDLLDAISKVDLPGQAPFLEAAARDDPDGAAGTYALSLFALARGADTPDDALDDLESRVRRTSPETAIPDDRVLAAFAAAALAKASRDHAQRIVPWLLDVIRPHPHPKDELVEALLRVAELATGRTGETWADVVARVSNAAWPSQDITRERIVDLLRRFDLPTDRSGRA